MKKLKLFLAACAAMVGLSANAQGWTGSEPAEGDFYLYNVGAGKFLNAGDRAANWGTNACLSANYGLDFTLEANGTDYNLNSKNSNGGASNYLATSLWTDGAATPWTFASVGDKVYNISNGGSYLAATSSGDDVELVSSGDGANAQWILVSRENVIAAMASATKDSPMNISFLLGAPDFNRNDTRAQNGKSWAWTNAEGNVTVAGPNANRGTFGCEFWNNTFDINQTLTDMPDGTYEFKIAGYGTNGTTYIYGNTTEVVFANQTSAANFGTALDNIADGQFAGNTTGRFNLIGGTLKVGVKRATNKSADWAVFDNAELIYYGLDLSEFESALAAAVAAAEAVEGTVPTAAYNVLADVVAEQNKTYTSAAEYTAATEAIVNATNTAKALQLNYTRYTNVKAAVLAVNNGIETATADAQVEAATDNTGIDAAVATVRQALADYLPTVTLAAGQTIDLTAALIDNAAPGMNGTTDYWTNSVNPSLQFNLYEFYNQAGATTKQTIATSLPAGNYKLSAIAYTRDNMTATLNAGENTVNLVGCGTINNREGGNTWIAAGNGVNNLVFNLAEATANLEIGLTADNATGDHWMCWRSFSLVYGDVFEPYTLAEGKMNKDVAAAQTQADATFKATPSPATYMAVINAIAAAEASIKAYAPMTAAVDKIDAALAAATSATESTDAYNAVKAAYTEATIADADIMDQVAAAYDAVIPVIKSQTAANADFTFAIQNQSFEYGDMTGWTATESSDTGVRETSNDTYAATGSDGYYLFNTWWQGVPLTQTVTGLPNGEYTLTASVASDGATIYLLANGEHNEGTETGNAEVTTYPTKDTFQEATFTFLVKDGNATIGVVGGADGEAGVHKDYVEAGYWWYKADNFRLVKNRELTEEEMAVAPTAIALYNGETEVTEVSLDATTTTVTLTPQFTPADATPNVTWASSDETVATVANGVVTAVAPGTATITVTSTLAEVSASATVTVTFPESTVPATYFVNDGASRTVYTLGENIIKNGSFEYPNPVYGWTTGTGSVNAMSTDYFNVPSEGAADGNKYLQAKASDGGAKPNSINTSWPLENGKTYVFGYKIKANKQCTTDLGYIGTSLSNTKGSENSSKKFETPEYGTEWQDVTYTFTNTDNYKFLVFNARWMANAQSFDNFYLCEATYKLEGNVDYATAAIPTANIGTGAFQYSQDAINAANALVQGTATVEDVTNAYNAVTTLNAPAEGKLYNIVNITEGFAHKGKALTFKAASDADLSANTTSMAWEAEPGYYMPQAVKFTAVEGVKNGYKLSYTRADGNVVYISTGTLSGLGNNHNQIRPTNDATKALTFEVTSVGDNHWYLKNTETGNNVGSNGDTGFYTAGGSNKDMKIQEAVNNEVALNIKAENQYGTIILPFNADAPAGVTVYSVSETQGATLTLVEQTTMEANTPYIVFAEEGATATLAGLGSAYNDANFTEGLLTGVYTQTDAPVGSYVLQKLNGTVAFYVVAEGKQPKVGANRAYLTKSESGVKAFYFGGDADAIQSVFDGLVNGDAYDLGGRKVSKLQKGNVYIVNGKKVVVK